MSEEKKLTNVPVQNSGFELQIIVDLRPDLWDGTGQKVGASGGLLTNVQPLWKIEINLRA
jgi:hypothetical protein